MRPGASLRTISAARVSMESLTGAKRPVTATERMPADFMSRSARARPLLVEGVRQGSRVLVAATHEPAPAADEGGQVLGPVGEGGDRSGGRERQAQDAHREQALSFEDGVGEVRRADHDGFDLVCKTAARRQHGPYRIDDALRDVRRGGGLVRGDDAAVHDHHRVRVRAADIHADSGGHGARLARGRGAGNTLGG